MSNAVLERIHEGLGNLVRTFNISKNYVDKDDPWLGILSAAAFAIRSTTNIQNVYTMVLLIFFQNIILQIEYTVYWELLRQKNQMKINKDNINKNRHRVDRDYKFRDNLMLTKHTSY